MRCCWWWKSLECPLWVCCMIWTTCYLHLHATLKQKRNVYKSKSFIWHVESSSRFIVSELCMMRRKEERKNKIKIVMFVFISFCIVYQNSWGILDNRIVRAFVCKGFFTLLWLSQSCSHTLRAGGHFEPIPYPSIRNITVFLDNVVCTHAYLATFRVICAQFYVQSPMWELSKLFHSYLSLLQQ